MCPAILKEGQRLEKKNGPIGVIKSYTTIQGDNRGRERETDEKR